MDEALFEDPLFSTPGVAVMKFRNPPVNSLSLEFLTEFVISLEKLENDKSIRGVILTSVCARSSHTHPSPGCSRSGNLEGLEPSIMWD